MKKKLFFFLNILGLSPSHGVFRIIQYGYQDRELDGTDLSAHWSFASLQKFGQNFIDQLKCKEINSPLLRKVFRNIISVIH